MQELCVKLSKASLLGSPRDGLKVEQEVTPRQTNTEPDKLWQGWPFVCRPRSSLKGPVSGFMVFWADCKAWGLW